LCRTVHDKKVNQQERGLKNSHSSHALPAYQI
jgi:hypothetical protein